MPRLFAIVLVAMLAVAQTFVDAQVVLGPGMLTGSLRDPDGRPVPNVAVALSQAGVAKVRTKTNAEGVFQFPGLHLGDYDFESSVAGFVKRYPVSVSTREETRFDILLQLGEVTEEVTVASMRGMPSAPPPSRPMATVRPLPAYEPDPDPCRSPGVSACLKAATKFVDVTAIPSPRRFASRSPS